MSRWQQFERYCIELTPILEVMSKNGLGISPERQKELFKTLTKERDGIAVTIQTAIPTAILTEKVWKRSPKVMTDDTFLRSNAEGKQEWYRRLPFNPGSWQQVQKLAASVGAKLPRKQDATSADDTSTDDKALKRVEKRHPVFKQIREWRKRNKLITAYQWPTDQNSRVHPVYGFHPSTWRKCVAKGTMIEIVRDVSKRPFGIPIEEVKPGDLAYTYDENGILTLRPVVWVKSTGIKKVIRLHWTTLGGHCLGFLDVTPDHLVMLTDGTYKEAQHIRISWGRRKRTVPGDSIMAVHRGILNTGYSRLAANGLPNGKTWMLDHRFIFGEVTGGDAEDVHHKDGNVLNNQPSNLWGLSHEEHMLIESHRRKRSSKGMYNHRITEIEGLSEPVEVYDMEVEGTHNFIANELCVHNSCRNPNIQTIPKRNDLAKAFRKMIVPRPGNILVEGDSAAIEAVIVGWLAGSTKYVRLARAGVHGWITSALHGEPISLDISDTALTAACQAAKKAWPEDYEKCKRVVHLSNYMGTPRRISEEYPEEFATEGSAKGLQDFYFNTEAGADIRAWQKQTIEIAHANKGLENHFGLRHRFYSLYSYDSRRGIYVLGEDAKRAVAFVPQSDASFVQSDILLRLVARDIRFLGWLVAIVHDSIILDLPVSEADYAGSVLVEEMTRPIPQLDNLWIGAEIKIGVSLGEMETWTIQSVSA